MTLRLSGLSSRQPGRSRLSVVIIALTLPALLLAVTLQYRDSDCTSDRDPTAGLTSTTVISMPVSYVCMGCNEGSRIHFTDYKSASCHYARSAPCNRSNRGIATIVLPNKATDQDAGGSGGAGPAWTGQPQRRRRQPQESLLDGAFKI